MAKEIKIGNDKQPAPLVESNVPLYNLQTGEILVDEGGVPLVSREDTFLTSEASSKKATSIVYTKEKSFTNIKNIRLSGESFSAQGKLISAKSGTGNFRGKSSYRFTFSSDTSLQTLTVGTTVGLLNTQLTGEVESINFSDSTFRFGIVFIANFSSSLSAGDTLFYEVDTEQIRFVCGEDISLLKEDGELLVNDTVLLPTGTNSENVKVYENRIVSKIIDNDNFEVSSEVTSDVNLFGELIKVKKTEVNPKLKVEEEFPEFSEVSSTILGIPKAEEQLGLFSNVSSYGLDEDDFLFYTNRDQGGDPFEWATRKNKIYGNRYTADYVEETEESAIVLRSFRTPYSYPYGPRGVPGYNSVLYPKFNTFLKLGCLLYDEYKNTNPGYANNFLRYVANHVTLDSTTLVIGDNVNPQETGPFIAGETIFRTDDTQNPENVLGTVYAYKASDNVLHFNEEIGYVLSEYIEQNPDADDPLIPIRGAQSGTTAFIRYDLTYDDKEKFFSNLISPLNPAYSTLEDFYAQVDIWTETYRDINEGNFNRPGSDTPISNAFVDNLPSVRKYIVNYEPSGTTTSGNILSDANTRPGYNTNRRTATYLESRKSFRYQPGRISGYTFGVRTSGDNADNNVLTEWGIGNETDDLLFQVRGSSFNIVRRSVVPFTDALLEENGLLDDEQVLITKDSQNNSIFNGIEDKQVYEIVVSRDNWNGDPINGNGPSGYFWEADKVTMYKIEFGWYGAIGIQFYAYIPVGNGEARWVKLHRFVIENKLGEPCMGDPYYKFKYKLQVDDYAAVRSPKFIYKYGTSCYIDGGDEGTVTVNTITSESKTAPIETLNDQRSNSLFAIQPKNGILNPLGIIVKNKKLTFPKELSVNSEGLLELSIVKCKACPGFGYTYQPNVNSEFTGTERLFENPSTGDGVNRSKVKLQELTKTVASDVSSGTTITLEDVDYLREGDVINYDPNEISNSPIQSNTLITSINGSTITLSKEITGSISTGDTIEIQPVFLQKDFFAKLIATRVWNTYIGEFDDNGLIQISGVDEDRYTTANLDTIDTAATGGTRTKNSVEYRAERTLPSFYKISPDGKTTIQIESPSVFLGRLSQYDKIAASTTQINGRKNSMLFLANFGNDTGIYSGGHVADWRIGVTSLKPESDGSGGIRWINKDNDQVELTDDLKLYSDYYAEGISKDSDGFETGDSNLGRIPPYTIDTRLDSPPGTNSGTCAFLDITVNPALFFSCKQIYGNLLPTGSTYILVDSNGDRVIGSSTYSPDINKWYLRTPAGGRFPFNYEAKGSEIGFNIDDPTGIEKSPDVGSGIKFSSSRIKYSEVINGEEVVYELYELSNNLPGIDDQSEPTDVTIWYVPVSLTSYRQAVTKAFDFNPFPLYFFIEMRDGARLNGSVIKEVGEVTNTYNPSWITSDGMVVSNSNISVGSIGNTSITTGDLIDVPPNFVSENRLSSTLVDTQNQSQVRPYEIIDKTFIGNGTKTISLESIFGFNKEAISPDLLNTTAYFFLATSKEDNSIQVQATLNYIEQQ